MAEVQVNYWDEYLAPILVFLQQVMTRRSSNSPSSLFLLVCVSLLGTARVSSFAITHQGSLGLAGSLQPANEPSFFNRKLRSLRTTAVTNKPRLHLSSAPPTTLQVAQYDSVVLECEAAGDPSPIIYWLKNGQRITQGSRSTDKMNMIYFEDDADSSKNNIKFTSIRSRLFIDCATSSYDEAEYSCVAENAFKRVSSNTKVQVVSKNSNFLRSTSGCIQKKSMGMRASPARITMWTYTKFIPIGSDVVLYCRAQGSPKASVTWMNEENQLLTDSEHMRISENGDLEIKNANFADMGGYYCLAENGIGNDKQSTFLYTYEPESPQ